MHKSTFAMAAAAAVLAASNVTAVQAEQRSGHHDEAHYSAAVNYSQSMQALQRAAQKLRESIQSLAQREPGPERDTALKAAREALHDTHQAMVQLPPELRTSPYTGGVAPGYAESMMDLKQAANRLYDAIHAMARQPAGTGRNVALQEARSALFDTELAMVWLPNASGGALARSGFDNASRGSVQSGSGTGQVAGGWAITAGPDASPVGGNSQAVAGGVGLNARAMLSNEAASDHNVKLVFSLASGNYLADVHVRVTNASGRTVIDGLSDGPWLYAKLPAGSYTATATYGGHTVTRQFTVAENGLRTAYLRWPTSVEEQVTARSNVDPILGMGPQEPR